MAEQPEWMKPKPLQKQQPRPQQPYPQQRPMQQRPMQQQRGPPGMQPGRGPPGSMRQPINKKKLPSAKKKKLLKTLIYLMIATAILATVSGLYFYVNVIKG